MNYFYTIIFLFLISCSNVLSQITQHYFLDYKWQNDLIIVNDSKSHILDFEFQTSNNLLNFDITINKLVYANCDSIEIDFIKNLNIDSVPSLSYKTGISNKKGIIRGKIIPFIKKNNHFKKIIYIELKFNSDNFNNEKKLNSSVNNSVLSSGNWYKISVNKDGIYKLSYQDLESLGIDVSALDPKKLRIFGRPAGLLPTENSSLRPSDLQELSIQMVDQNDGTFDESDYVLFYGQSPNRWLVDNTGLFTYKQHYYDNNNYYFINTDIGQGKRINSSPKISSFDTIINSFNDYQIHENDEVNFIKSGKNWFGNSFDLNDSQYFNFNFPNRTGNANIKIVLAANATVPHNSNFTINSSGISNQDILIPGLTGSYNKANVAVYENTINSVTDNIQIELEFNSSSSSAKGWIDYIQINTERDLKMTGSQMSFRSLSSVKTNSKSQFHIINSTLSLRVWDVTFPLNPQLMELQDLGSYISFNASTDTLREFISFSENYLSSNLIGKINNQNLHAFTDIDYLIIAPNLFLEQANRLANFHRSNGLKVEVVTPLQIYNEFSSGCQDVSAIRDFAKKLYENESPLKYLLLFGDASYDPKDRLVNNTNFIISYQSNNSTNELYSYVSDDYFAILDDEESITSDNNIPFLDIGVGRFPVQTIQDAKIAVDKVISYSSEHSFGDWRLNMCFVGDDNDEIETIHSLQAEQLADLISENYPSYNIDKIYLDAYQQQSSTGGQRCPSVNEAISEAINKGMFLVNYTGHGGEMGWAHERILEVDDINSWRNTNKLPLFMTATCEFSRYDDPDRISAGEQVFLKENGGAIALLTTSRVVFTGSNLDLNTSFLENLFPTFDEPFPRLGDVLKKTKNNVTDVSNTNHRNFTLLGDPALQLAYPKYDVVLTQVKDTAKALDLITVSGEIQINGTKINNYNGLVFPKVYDKKRDYQTLGQDESPIFVFDLQKNLIFKGKSSVQNGEFSFSFIVPKDINYDYGYGKISLYAKGMVDDTLFDANGFNMDMIIGGTSSQDIKDHEGPKIDLFINDTNFVSGGITDNNPSLFAKLYDENGINTVGNGIGHEMIAILNDESTNPIVLNDFYEYDINSYTSGTINYPFNNLSEGMYSLSTRVWDVNNNSSEETIEFIVISSNKLTIENLINYPNPMIDHTSFYFEHNQNNEDFEIVLRIIDLQGKIVKEIKENISATGNRYGPITWNARSEKGIKLKSGIYIYSLFTSLSDGTYNTKSGRLILID